MRNDKLRKRIIYLLAISYAKKEENLIRIYEKSDDINLLLNLLEDNKLEEYLEKID